MNLSLARKENFGSVMVNFYRGNKDVWMTREQIGESLEYSDPNTAIAKIHMRNKDRLDKFSVTTKLVGTDGKLYDTYVYNRKGIMEICRFSRQEKADLFIDWAWEIIDKLMEEGYVTLQSTSIEDLIIMQAQTLKDIRLSQERIRYEQEQLKLQQSQTENKVTSITTYLSETPDRKKIEREVNAYARRGNMKEADVRVMIYRKIEDKYGIDVMQRVRNKHKQMNQERVAKDLKPYAQSTLKSKYNGMDFLVDNNMLKDVMEILAGIINT